MGKKGIGFCTCTQDSGIVEPIKMILTSEKCCIFETVEQAGPNDDIIWLVFSSPAAVSDASWITQLSKLSECSAPMISVILKWVDMPSEVQMRIAGKTTYIQANKAADSFVQWLKQYGKTKDCFPQLEKSCTEEQEYTGPYYLFRKKTGDRVKLSAGNCRIGSKKEVCDWTLLECPGVSRLHATVSLKDEECYIKDEDSKNGTFVNGQRIPPGKPTRIYAGDEIHIFREHLLLQRDES